MNISIIAVGKLKEKYLKQAIDEYSKRLSRYCKLEVIELPDEKTPDNASEKEEQQILRRRYIDNVKANFRVQLEGVELKNRK